MPRLHVGMVTVQVAPPLGLALVGFLRRYRSAEGLGQPLEVSALVVDDGGRRAAIIALDLLGTPAAFGREIRQTVARAAACPAGSVLVNSQHTHAAPPPPGLNKMGGHSRDMTAAEEA